MLGETVPYPSGCPTRGDARCCLTRSVFLPFRRYYHACPPSAGGRVDLMVNDAITRSPPEGSEDERMEGWMREALSCCRSDAISAEPGDLRPRGEAERVNRGTDFLPFRCLRFNSAAWSDTSQPAAPSVGHLGESPSNSHINSPFFLSDWGELTTSKREIVSTKYHGTLS